MEVLFKNEMTKKDLKVRPLQVTAPFANDYEYVKWENNEIYNTIYK